MTEEDLSGSEGRDANLGPAIAIFGMFAALGVMTAAIAYAVATQVNSDARSLFKTVAVIASVLAVLTGYLAIAAWRRWWPLSRAPHER